MNDIKTCFKKSTFYLVSVAEQASLSLIWSGFLSTRPNYEKYFFQMPWLNYNFRNFCYFHYENILHNGLYVTLYYGWFLSGEPY